MQKHLLLLLTTMLTPLLALDLELDMGMGLYYTGAKGQIDYVGESFQGSNAKADLIPSGQFYIWADVKSKNPYLPRARFEYLKVSADGDSNAHLEISNQELMDLIDQAGLNDQNWNSYLQHNMYDFILYYDFLEKSAWPTVGVGLGYRIFDYIYIMDIDISDISGTQFGDRDDSSAPIVYLNTRYEAPSLNMGFEADAKMYLSDSSIYDWRIKMDLMFEVDADTMAGLEFGYRGQYYSLAGGDVENVKGDMSYQGVFVGGTIHFK